MFRRIALRSSLRITLVLLIGVALLPAPCVSMLVSAMGQGEGRGPRAGPPPPQGYENIPPPSSSDVSQNADYLTGAIFQACHPRQGKSFEDERIFEAGCCFIFLLNWYVPRPRMARHCSVTLHL